MDAAWHRKGRKHTSFGLILVTVAATVGFATLAPGLTGTAAAQEPEPAATEAPDARTAGRLAKSSGHRVEVLAERTEKRQVFAEPSGDLTAEVHAVPVRVRKDGAWRSIDLTLRPNADGTVGPVASPADVRFSGGGSGPLVALGADDKRLRLFWNTPLPAPTLAGDTATYAEVLPGVDLVVVSTVDGYRERLVVKNSAAAANPALRRIPFRMETDGLTVEANPDGSLDAVDATGAPVFAAGTPLMWDTPRQSFAQADHGTGSAAEAILARQRPIQVSVTPTQLTVVPRADVLTDPNAGFPIVIDPDFGAGANAWLHISLDNPNQNGWGWDQGDGAKVGKSWDSGQRYRSFFQYPIGVSGAIVTAAYLRITLDHSASCTPSAVQLWHTGGIWNGTTWNNTGHGHWLRHLDTRSANANEAGGCSTIQPDVQMEFGGPADALRQVVQQAVSNNAGAITFGLKAANEGDRYQWKKFFQHTSVLQFTYNHPPNTPAEFSTVPATPCGTATAPTPLNTTTPTFTARLLDPNQNNMAAQVQINDGATTVWSSNSATVTHGSVITWPSPPAGALPDNQPTRVFSYRAQAWDTSGHFSAWTAPCYFIVDRQIPGTPTVESDDFPDGEAVTAVGEPGSLRIAPGYGPDGQPDADLSGYRYGFQQDKLTGWAPADASGRATIPMVLWQTSRTLYVQAVDRAGNPSINDTPCICTVWDLRATGSAATPAKKPADLNGDGRGDVTAVLDMGNGRTAAWNVVTNATGGVYAPYIGWDSGNNGGFPGYRTKAAQGDFNGDGFADLAVLREDPDRRLRLFFLKADSHRYDADPAPEWEGPLNSTQWTLNNVQIATADATGDGRADLLAFVAVQVNQFAVYVFPGTTSGLSTPTEWYTNPVNDAEPARIKFVAGDFDGDGFGDAAYFYNYDGFTTKVWIHYNTRAGRFHGGIMSWDSGPGNWDWTRVTPVVGNVDGDTAGAGGRGRDDIIAMYNYDGGGANTGMTRFFVFKGTNTNEALPHFEWWYSGGYNTFHSTQARLSTADVDADGKSDVVAFYGTTAATAAVHVFRSNATGTGAITPNLAAAPWSGRIGAVAPTFVPEAGRRYWIRPRHSGQCLRLRGAATGEGVQLEQGPCVDGQDHLLFELRTVANGPLVNLVNVGSGRCADVRDGSHQNSAQIFTWTCNGLPQQSWRLEYVAATGLDTVIRPRAGHSDKCIPIGDASQAAGAVPVQWDCPGSTNEYYVQLRP